jgi:hypothetical protein
MIRFCLRLFGLLLLATAFAALVVDGTRAIAAGVWRFSSLDATLGALGPDTAANLLLRLPVAWRAAGDAALKASPTCVVLGAIGFLLFALTLRRRDARDAQPSWEP